jgi:hypothetical protein
MPPKKKATQSGAGLGKTAKKVLKAAHDIAKQQRLISRGLAMTPLAPIAPVARMLGYGKKKRKTTKKPAAVKMSTRKVAGRPRVKAPVTKVVAPRYSHQVGNGIFSDLGGGIGSIFGGLGSGIGSLARGVGGGLFGGKRVKPRPKAIKM